MSKRNRFLLLLVSMVALMTVAAVAHADPLDDAGRKVGAFAGKAGTLATGLIPVVGGGAITLIALQRKVAKASGQQDMVNRANEQIMEVLKLCAIGTGASLLVAIAGSVLG